MYALVFQMESSKQYTITETYTRQDARDFTIFGVFMAANVNIAVIPSYDTV